MPAMQVQFPRELKGTHPLFFSIQNLLLFVPTMGWHIWQDIVYRIYTRVMLGRLHFSQNLVWFAVIKATLFSFSFNTCHFYFSPITIARVVKNVYYAPMTIAVVKNVVLNLFIHWTSTESDAKRFLRNQGSFLFLGSLRNKDNSPQFCEFISFCLIATFITTREC